MLTLRFLLMVVMLSWNSGCASSDAVHLSSAATPSPPRVTSLNNSLDPLIDHFNANAGKPRLLAIVSSTCPACVYGAQAVRDSVLELFPDADISVSVVWIDMLPTDNKSAANASAKIFGDPRVRQFHDPLRKAGWAIAGDLLNEGGGPAWDIYLFYDEDARWGDAPPVPIDWMHQLGGAARADPSRFRPGPALREELTHSMNTLFSNYSTESPFRSSGQPCG